MEEMEMTKNEALKEHVRSHVSYPATRAQLLQSCMVGKSRRRSQNGGGSSAG